MPVSIVLTTLNATYAHCAFGLRYLYANLKEFRTETEILEFTIAQKATDIVEHILRRNPKVVGFGVYIWNTRQTFEVVSILKRVRPEILVVLGGPEVSFEYESQAICRCADYTFLGESDFSFYEFCRDYLNESRLPATKWIASPLPDIAKIASPYPWYTEEDLRHRVLYVEASRGCPYRCEFCLSSLDKSVRNFALPEFLADCEQLIARGARQFKFVDRTFNLSIATSSQILEFFLRRIDLGLFLHFEMVPDRLPLELRALIARFPAGSLQFEIGIQTWNPEVAKHVSRRQNYSSVTENFAFLRAETHAHLHADLIVGLPGETLESFAAGFDAVAALGPHEIQVGILKRLKGTPIVRHEKEWEMLYQSEPPFAILQNKCLSFVTVQRLTRFAKFWELFANRGNFKNTVSLLKNLALTRSDRSWFWEFFDFSLFLSERHPQNFGVALVNLVESAWIYLTEKRAVAPDEARAPLVQDYCGYVKRDLPAFLRVADEVVLRREPAKLASAGRKRQERHLMNEVRG